MIRTIKITEDVYSRLEKHAAGFDSPSDVISRLLDYFEKNIHSPEAPKLTPSYESATRKDDGRLFSNTEIQQRISSIAESLTDHELETLCDKFISKQLFGIDLPLFIKVSVTENQATKRQAVSLRGYKRWTWKYEFVRNRFRYAICTQWYPRNDPFVQEWLNDHESTLVTGKIEKAMELLQDCPLANHPSRPSNSSLMHDKGESMSATTIGSILAIFEKEFGVNLSKMPGKQIIYEGKTKHAKSIVVIMPESKIYDRDNGWVDFTKIQIDICKRYQIAVAAFRLANRKTYFIDMSTLFPLLTQSNIMENEREGEHWKMDIWLDKIVIRNGGQTLCVKPNEYQFIGQLVQCSCA